MSPITTHVLDTSQGRPAQGVPVVLESRRVGGRWKTLAKKSTNADGRVADLFAGAKLPKGVYRLSFNVSRYFRALKKPCFYPEIAVVFEVSDGRHYHVPLLVSPFGYSTYRGS